MMYPFSFQNTGNISVEFIHITGIVSVRVLKPYDNNCLRGSI